MRWALLFAMLCTSVACAANGPAATAPTTARGATPDASENVQRRILLMLRAPPSHYRPDASYGDRYATMPGHQARRRIARALAREHGLRLGNDWPMPALDLECFVLDVAEPASVERLVQELEADPRVESAQPMQVFHLLGRGDPLYAAQPAAADWHLQALHALTTGKGVLVAVVDSGVAASHPDLRGQVVAMRNFVDDRIGVAETHGTEVAGIIAARADNGIGIAGIAPRSRLLALRACAQAADGSSACSSLALAAALQFAIERNARVLNLSLSGPRDRLLGRLLDAAMARGAIVVSAVDAQAEDGGFPASHPGVLAVTDDKATRAPVAALLASGRSVPATTPDDGWALASGASFAAAQVSGLVALLRQLSPGLSAHGMHDVLAPTPGVRLATERPRPIDACAAVLRADGRCVCNCATTSAATLAMPHP
ncbi:MAG: S8 family serine peptidase [Luteimonas sp.]